MIEAQNESEALELVHQMSRPGSMIDKRFTHAREGGMGHSIAAENP
jgi:hypothetical protein